MMDESEIRHRFAELRETDRGRAPDFGEIYTRARRRRSRRAIPRAAPLLIGAAAAAVLFAIWLSNDRSVSHVPATAAIATWRAPTDAFLRTSGSELLTSMPTLGASVLDKMIPTLSNRGT